MSSTPTPPTNGAAELLNKMVDQATAIIEQKIKILEGEQL